MPVTFYKLSIVFSPHKKPKKYIQSHVASKEIKLINIYNYAKPCTTVFTGLK